MKNMEDFYSEICKSLEADGDLCKRLKNERGNGMQMKHWAMIALVLAVGYYLGTKYPNLLGSVAAAA